MEHPITDVYPSIHVHTWDELEAEITAVAPFVRGIHLNISDGTMGSEETVSDLSRLAELVRSYPDILFEAHLLTANPEKHIRTLVDSGIKRLIAHVECNDPRLFLAEARYDEVEVGLAIDGATEVEQIEPFLELIDVVSVMTTEAGVVGGTFLPESVEKIKQIRQNYPDLTIEAVGGITDMTVHTVKEAGATILVASEFVFKHADGPAAAIELLQTG